MCRGCWGSRVELVGLRLILLPATPQISPARQGEEQPPQHWAQAQLRLPASGKQLWYHQSLSLQPQEVTSSPREQPAAWLQHQPSPCLPCSELCSGAVTLLAHTTSGGHAFNCSAEALLPQPAETRAQQRWLRATRAARLVDLLLSQL